MKHNATTVLAYLGTVPFIAAAIFISLGYQQLFFIDDLATMVSSYGLIIVVFMAGVHWGNYLSDEKSHPINFLVTSNVITLAVWFAYLSMTFQLTLLVYCFAFIILLYLDARLLSFQVISNEYFKLRAMITSIVIISLFLIIFSSLIK